MKVKKSTKKHTHPPKDVIALADSIVKAPDDDLISVLQQFDSWKYPRGDLHTWVDVLDRFDDILADITKSYELNRIQTNEFTPKTKQLVHQILRVQRLLLENCTSRKLFSSYDRLADLLHTSDLDILYSTIFVLLRPAQQYARSIPFENAQRHSILHRLLTLSRGWERLINAGLDMSTLASSAEVTLPEELKSVQIQYYPTSSQNASSSPAKTVMAQDTPTRLRPAQLTTPSASSRSRSAIASGPSTLDLGNVTAWSSPTDQLTHLSESNSVPLDDQYNALNKIRLSQLGNLATRRQLLAIRLLALATYIYISTDDAAQSGLFLYEPDLVLQLAELLKASPHIGEQVTIATIHAIDACAHHRAKTAEVLTAVSANVQHGILVTFLRRMVERLTKGGEYENIEFSLHIDSVPVDLFDAAISFVAYIPNSPAHVNMLMGAGIYRILLDMLGAAGDRRESVSYPLPSFADIQYIPRATGLIDSIIFASPQALSNFSNVDGVNFLVHRVKAEIELRNDAATPTPTSTLSEEGLRNLVDSELPKCIKLIFEQPAKFGPRVYAMAINIMATFVHNEPTSLSILQELQLPQTLYAQLENEVPPSPESGLEYTVAHPSVVTNLISAVNKPNYQHIFDDRENAKGLGAALDELSRHQPLLRPIIMKASIDLLCRASKDGAAFEPSANERKEYILNEMSSNLPEDPKQPPVPPNNPCLASFSRIFKVLNGLVRNAATSKDFIQGGGLDQVLGLAELPCLPIRFGTTEAAASLSGLLRHIGEHDHAQLIHAIVTSVQQAITSTSDLWDTDRAARWSAMDAGDDDADNQRSFKIVRSLGLRLSFLSDVIFTLSFTNARNATSLIKSIGLNAHPDFLLDLARVHRVAYQQHVVLKKRKTIVSDDLDSTKAQAVEERDSGAKYLATRLHAVLTKFFKTERIVAPMDDLSATASDTRDQEQKDAFVETTAGVKIVLLYLSALASTKSFLENPETHALKQRSESPLVAVNVFIKIRLAIFPLAHRIWEAPWLLECPVSTLKLAARCFSTLLEGKSEESATEDDSSRNTIAPTIPTLPVARPTPVVADPVRVDQLVDMGFPRGSAERALIRARNNVTAATDLILSMPHMFSEEPVAVQPAEQLEQSEAPPQPVEGSSSVPLDPDAAHVENPLNPVNVDIVDEDTALSDRELLKQLREQYHPHAASRALILLDHAEDLVFDVLPCFPIGEEGIRYLIGRLVDLSKPYEPAHESAVSARLRLMSLYLRSADGMMLDESSITTAIAILSHLPLEHESSRPRWFPALLLFAEAIAASSHGINKVKIGDDPGLEISTSSPAYASVAPKLSKACIQLISKSDVTRNELVSALRLMVLLTREAAPLDSDTLHNLLLPFKQPSEKVSGCHSLLLLIVRHAFEDVPTLTDIMRQEVRHWLSPTRSKVVDIQHFLKQLRQAALREPHCFVRAVEDECALVDPTPPQSVYHIRSNDKPKDATASTTDHSDPFQGSANDQRHPLIDHVISELGQAVRDSLDGSDDQSEQADHAHTYVGLLMSILTELLGSYTCVKKAFIASVREQGLGTSKSKLGVATLISDLVCCVVLQPDVTGVPQFDRGSKPARRLAISSWSSSLVLALCSDISLSSNAKESSEDMSFIRKSVLDAITKTLRDLATTVDLPVRYGRLWALGELLYRLLIARPLSPARDLNDSTPHIAKTMLEKNFVGLITNALGEIDLNYPEVRNVLVSLLRTLDHLEDEVSSDSDTESNFDIDMNEEDEAGPDLYRNSALGMIGGEMGDDEDEDDDEDDDDEDMDMGDDITDDDGATDMQTSEDESMGSDLDPDNWTDDLHEEDEGSEGDEAMDQEVILGSNEDDEEGEIWDVSFFEGDDEQELELDEEDSGMHRHSPDITAPWAWDQSSFHNAPNSRRHRSVLAEDPTVSLFGRPPQRSSGSTVAQHPLITDPHSQSAPMRGLSRHVGGNYGDLISAIEGMGGTEAVQMLENLIASRQVGGTEAIRIDFAQDQNGTVGLSVGGRTFSLQPPQSHHQQASNSDVLSEYVPVPTMQRWQEEMNMATAARTELINRLIIHIINRLMPEARRRAEEELAKIKKEEAEAAELEAEEQKKNLASATSVALPQSPQIVPEDIDQPMGESNHSSLTLTSAEDAEVPEVVATESLARTVISIHGRDVDITDTGIDLEFLQALPDDMRADVVDQHMREQNRHRRPPITAANIPESASQINSEFLDALPPEIRAEVIMHEAMEAARRHPPPDAAVAPDAGRAAGFLAGLTNELRDVMLLNQPGDLGPLRVGPSRFPEPPATNAKKPHREGIQLLEKPGIASLVRLLFFPETLKKGYLFRVLVNLCENSTTRSDLLNLLLSVVQDGSGDLPAVDRSFQQMSLRGVVTPKATPKNRTVESPAAAVVPTSLFSHLQTEHIPTFIAQRCFEALVYIVNSNASAVQYFLSEHEQPVGLKRHLSKKGKGKDRLLPQTKFPIVVLLGLLDRPLLAKTPGMMETVASLLVTITKPLAGEKADNKPDNDPSAKSSQPVIPGPVLRLIVNCLTSGECTSRTFTATLVAMQNLACLPDAKEVILQELRSRCKDLGLTVSEQLAELASGLQDKSTDIGSLTLTNFSPPTSTQAQLLRLLKTIDYLHLNKVDSDLPSLQMTDEEQAVNAVFESFEFTPLWEQLGHCLSLVESRGNTDQIATVLLPLVEALMVVSKFRSRTPRQARSTSAPPNFEDNTDLFVSFTTTHRKVLNTIVRNNPSLLSGSFSLLIGNPRVLEFDNKRNWFFQKLKRKRDPTMPTTVIPLNIRRQYVFEDSFHALQRRTGDEIKYGKLSVKFYNEDGVDAGGVTREWYSVLAQQIFDPNFALFEPCAADQQTYQPNKASSVNGDHLAYFKFVGRVIGKAVYDGRLLDAYFNRAFYKQILGRTVDMRDLESIDPEYHKSLQWMLDNDITGVIDQEFTIEDDQFGEKKIVEIKPGGSAIPVTEENKEEYVKLVVSYRLDNSIKDQIKAFLDGFYDIIPRQLIQIFEPDQLELLISGITTVDVDELKNATQLSGWKATDPEISWFWRALRSFSQEERSRFLMFVTSSSRVPLGGFAQLQGSSGTQPFQMQKLYAKEGSLPQASTCFNLLLLPTYASYEQLREKLQFAIMETGGFGKA
ncbi:uncharacterized protein IL334_007090 [Kwoniella shivajii]|uniref:HECT-type E3 ubiquitin transferase n=1 Tax=Kwoniella shivajii TaxID=564305 RepID=A0ABZ1D8H2_9TREE|nr:hypothetical protein IL334_007090 [Kwoniella shivajii]